MSQNELITVIVISLLLVMLPAPGLYGMFRKAGVEGWKAFVPFYNTWVMLDIAKRKKHWFFWQFIPVVGWFITMGIIVEFVKPFGKFKFYQHAAAVLMSLPYLAYVGFNKKDRFLGVEYARKHKKSSAREWVDAGVFAVVAATLIRTFVFEAYTIPTPSMEKTLLVNDFLFVSKFSYGPRIPNTPLAVPFVHHTIPGLNTKSYSELIRIPYTRWFASPVKRNDVVVFNFPAGDTLTKEEDSRDPYYDILRREEQRQYFQLKGQYKTEAELVAASKARAREVVWYGGSYTITTRPVDKRENYIKRCVGVAGDSIKVVDDEVYINGAKSPIPPQSQLHYIVSINGNLPDYEIMKEEYNLDEEKGDYITTGKPGEFRILLTNEAREKMQKKGLIKEIKPEYAYFNGGGPTFPYDTLHNWTRDNFGPVWIPKKNATITLTAENYAIYERPIRVYENNKLDYRNGKFYINDKETTQYTFKMDYYWMMGDNRMDSQDSRFWGFVPEDHVVGEAGMIWMSWEGGIRWRRLFNIIR